MPPDRFLEDATPGEAPAHEDTQQLVEAESGRGAQGINRRWQASNSAAVVLTSDAAGVKISRDAGATPPAQVIVDGTTAGNGLAGTYPNPSLAPATMDLLAPPGAIIAWAGLASPPGWLPCDGRLLASADYPRLFAAITTIYGFGGPGTFRLPDLQGRVIVSASGTHALATAAGQESVVPPAHSHPGTHNHAQTQHQHQVNAHEHDMQNHAHTLSAHTHGQNGHIHTTNLAHDHPNAPAAATATATAANSILNGTGSSTSVPAATHDHPVNLPALAPTNADSGPPSNPDTQGPSAANTGGNSGNTSTLAAANTQLSAAVNTGDSSAAPGANYAGATIATMMPFLTLQFVIRAV